MEYTAIGDTMNLAARLEGLTKSYRVDTLLCGATSDKVQHSATLREIDRVRVKGKQVATPVHDIVWANASPPAELQELIRRSREAFDT